MLEINNNDGIIYAGEINGAIHRYEQIDKFMMDYESIYLQRARSECTVCGTKFSKNNKYKIPILVGKNSTDSDFDKEIKSVDVVLCKKCARRLAKVFESMTKR